MRLGDFLEHLTGEGAMQPVTGFAIDHRKVAPGNIFGAFQGAKFNAEDFIPLAVEAGAIGVVARTGVAVKGAELIADDHPRRRFARIAAQYYRPFPEKTVAVTGTNGKTSVVELTRQLWRMAGHNSASIGTLGITTGSENVRTGLTSPDIVTFLSNMAGLAREGVTHAAFEASSHGLDQYRSEGLPIRAAAFTNLSRDHLDYHGGMNAYFEAKMRLFDEVLDNNGTAVIWADDDYSDAVFDRVALRSLRRITVGRRGEGLRLVSQTPTQLGQTIEVEVQGRIARINLPLIGAYQANNALTAAGLVIATGGDWEEVKGLLARVQPVRGRLERAVISRSGAPVYVDYAHTPDGLKAACEALRAHCEGRLITVFGAGGDRDTGKRAAMGKTAEALSDVVIVTDDNPRGEDPASIRRAVLEGAPDAAEIGDRRDAISAAIAMAKPDDIVLLAGKGHEQGQIVGDRTLPFDDVEVARETAA